MKAGRALRCAALAATCVVAAIASATTLEGRVVAVHDGDTLTVLVQHRAVRVRLAGIDAPERGQPYAQASRRALAARAAGRTVTVDVRGRDAYGRTLGVVRVEREDVNRALVRDGWAWVFRRYAHDASLRALEEEARRERRGLWRDAHPQPPWEWRDRAARIPEPAVRRVRPVPTRWRDNARSGLDVAWFRRVP